MAKKSKKANLAKYSKEDLIWIINRMSAFGDSFRLNNALLDLKHKKEMELLDEADRISKLSSEKWIEYLGLILQYDEKPPCEIPLPILEKAQKLMEEAKALDEKWNRLMGI